MLFLGALLFVILSSGSLQCALNCYDHAARNSANRVLATDCHPLDDEKLAPLQVSSFCHHGRSASEARTESQLLSIRGRLVLALFDLRCDAPTYRSAEPFSQPFATLASNSRLSPEILPLSQNLKHLRSTILLM